jgi:hypothetical protein
MLKKEEKENTVDSLAHTDSASQCLNNDPEIQLKLRPIDPDFTTSNEIRV